MRATLDDILEYQMHMHQQLSHLIQLLSEPDGPEPGEEPDAPSSPAGTSHGTNPPHNTSPGDGTTGEQGGGRAATRIRVKEE